MSGGNSPGSFQHLSLYIDRGDGVEPVRAGPEGFEAELTFEGAANYVFYVISRKPHQTGGYTLVFIPQARDEPQPVHYHMIYEEILEPKMKRTRGIQILPQPHPVLVRADAVGFKPKVETFLHENGSRTRISKSFFTSGDSFATANIVTSGPTRRNGTSR